MAKRRKRNKIKAPSVRAAIPPVVESPPVRVWWWVLLLVAAATVVAFWPTLWNDFVDWDDTDTYIRNQNYRGLAWSNIVWMFTTFHMGHYQPLTWLTLGWDAVWGQWVFGPHKTYGPGMNARAYHLTNNLIHTINAALVYMLALRLITWPTVRRETWPPWLPHLAAAGAAMVFALHPMRVENVAWLTERRDLLSALLLLLTMLAWLGAVYPDARHRRRWYWVSITLYALSLLAKVAGVPLVAVLLVLDWYPLRRTGTLQDPMSDLNTRTGLRLLVEKLPFMALAAIFSFVATTGQAANNWLFPFERHPLTARIVQCFYGLAFYVCKMIVPTDLLPLYELRLPMPIGQPQYIAAIVAVVVGAALVCILRVRLPALFVAMLCYAAFLAPVLGLFQNGPQIVADRYSYLPTIGLSIVIGALLLVAWRRLPWRGFALSCAALAAALATLALLSWKQTQVWRDTASLWTYNCAKDPGSSFAQNGYGYVLLSKGEVDAAIPHFREAARIQPDNRKAHENLWNALESKGDLAGLLQAYISFGEALPNRIQNNEPVSETQYRVASRKANQLLNAGRASDAVPFFALAVKIRPEYPRTRTNYGVALTRINQFAQAEEQYRIAMQQDPNLFEARYNAGVNYQSLNRLQEAKENFEVALRLKPGDQATIQALQSVGAPPATVGPAVNGPTANGPTLP